MSTLNRQQIQARAVTRHGLQFLKSQAVAEAAATRIVAYLGGRISTVRANVGESKQNPGTWQIYVWYIRRAELSYANTTDNRNDDELITAAVKAAYRPTRSRGQLYSASDEAQATLKSCPVDTHKSTGQAQSMDPRGVEV